VEPARSTPVARPQPTSTPTPVRRSSNASTFAASDSDWQEF